MAQVRRKKLSNKEKLALSGFILTWDPSPWNLQIDFRFSIDKAYAEHMMECLRSIIEKRTLEGVDFNGKPFAKYKNSRWEEAKYIRRDDQWPYTYRNRNLQPDGQTPRNPRKGPFYERTYYQRERPPTLRGTRRDTAMVKRDGSMSKWGFKYKKPGDKVTLHSKNNPNEGCWKWNYTVRSTSGQWRSSDGVGTADNFFGFYPWIFKRAKRVKRRKHVAYAVKTPQKLKNTRLAKVDDNAGPRLDKKAFEQGQHRRVANHPTRNHPLWVLHWGRATEHQATSIKYQIAAKEQRIKDLYQFKESPYVGEDRIPLDQAIERYKSMQIDPAVRRHDVKAYYYQIEGAKKRMENIDKLIAEAEYSLDRMKHKLQTVTNANLRVPDRRWFGFTDDEARTISGFVEKLAMLSFTSYEKNVIKVVADSSRMIQSGMDLYDENGKHLEASLDKAQALARIDAAMVGVNTYIQQNDAYFRDFENWLEGMGGSAFLGITDRGPKYSQTDKQKIVIGDWDEMLREQMRQAREIK